MLKVLRGLIILLSIAALLLSLSTLDQNHGTKNRTSVGPPREKTEKVITGYPEGNSQGSTKSIAESEETERASSEEFVEASSKGWQEQLAERVGSPEDGRLNVLLLGIDSRGKEPSRSDSIILISINSQDNTAVLLSIMRDTYVNIPTPKPVKNRINAAYTLGGPSLTTKTVSNFLHIPIDYYVVADFQGFEKAVDAIGGVEVEVEKPMDYVDDGRYDIHLKAGTQLLNGQQALGYARFRHDPRGDYARVERQRKLLKAMLNKMEGVQAVYYLPKILDAVKPYIKTNLDLAGLASLAYQGYKLNEMDSFTVPSPQAHTPAIIDGMSVLIPDVKQTRKEVENYLGQGGE